MVGYIYTAPIPETRAVISTTLTCNHVYVECNKQAAQCMTSIFRAAHAATNLLGST